MEAQRKFIAANVLICVGIAPVAIWAFAIASASQYGFGLSDLVVLGISGVVAYTLTMLISGVGFLWVDRVVRASHVEAPRFTRMLVQFLGIVLLAPWVILLGRIVIRAIR